MINVMLIAGDKTEKLSKFLQQKGTFDIEYAYRSLTEEIVSIKDNIVNVDKLVYLLDNQILNIRTEMQLLKELLTTEGFFTAREIIFIVTENVDTDKAIKYFKTVMIESDFQNYSINKTKNKVSFADVFDYIIGITHSDNYKNTFKEVYRVERHSDSDVAYIAQDDSDMLIEPFSYDRLKSYEAAKENSRRTESGILHKDIDTGINVSTAPNVDLGDLQVVDSVKRIETIIVTGERKTGISTWASALAISAIAAGKTVTLIDFTDNFDIADLLEDNNQMFYPVRILEMLHNYKYVENSINLVSTFNEQEQQIRTEFLQHVFTNRNSLAPVCIIAIPEKLFETVQAILVQDISRILYCINPIFHDVIAKQSCLAHYSKLRDFFIVLNDRITLMDSTTIITKEELEGLLPFGLPIIQSINFDNLNIDASLFKSLMEIKND